MEMSGWQKGIKLDFNDFLEELEKHGRREHFSYEGKKALFNYLNEVGEDLIVICCDFIEFENWEDFQDYYKYDIDCMDDLYYHTTVIPIDDKRFIIQDF